MVKLKTMKRFQMHKYIGLVIGLSLCLGTIQAQDTIKLNFQDAVVQALKANVDYRTQENNMEILKKEKQVALLSHLPAANASVNFARQNGQQFQQIEGEIVVTNVTNEIVSSNVNLNMPIFNSGRRIFDTQSARLAYQAGQEGINRASQQVVFEVARLYLQVLLDQELLRIAEQNLENQQEQLRQIEGFVDAGLRTVSDLYNQQSEVARVESVQVDAEIQLENDLWSLAEYLQLEIGAVPELSPLENQAATASFESLELSELYEIAQTNRVDKTQQELLVEATKKDMKAMKAMYYPRLNAFFNYNSFFTSLDSRTFQEQYFRIYPQNTFGLNLIIPIFNNFQSRLDVSRVRVAHQNQILQKESLDRKIVQEVKLAHQNYLGAIQKEANTDIQVRAAEEAALAVRERFRLGLSNFVDLSTANQQLVNAQSDQAQATFTLYFQEVVMQHALGTLELPQ